LQQVSEHKSVAHGVSGFRADPGAGDEDVEAWQRREDGWWPRALGPCGSGQALPFQALGQGRGPHHCREQEQPSLFLQFTFIPR